MSAPHQRPIARPKPRLLHEQQRAEDSDNGEANNASVQKHHGDDETAQERKKRSDAARILLNYEQLVWISMARNESLVQTRLYYEAVLAGYPVADPQIEWPTEYQDGTKALQGRSPAGKGKARIASDSHGKTRPSAMDAGPSALKKAKEKDRTRRSLGGT